MNMPTSTVAITEDKLAMPEKRDRLLMILLFIISGNPAMSFGLPNQPIYAGVAIILFCLMLYKHIKIISPTAICISIFFAFIFICQTYSFSFFSLVTILGFFTRLFIAYAVVRLVRDFARTYVDIIYILAILSFLFYIPQQLGNIMGYNFSDLFRPIEPLFGVPEGWRMTLFLHTFHMYGNGLFRNDGMFWEPGALAGYISIGIVLLAAIRYQYNSRTYWKRLIVLLLCLLTTLSTTGYIVLPLVLLLHLRWRSETAAMSMQKLTMCVYVVALGGAFFYTYVWEQPFMKEKIANSIKVSQYKKAGWEADRLGTFLFDLDYIWERPLTGWGLHGETRHALHPFLKGLLESGRGNGMSDFAAKLGIPALLLWMYFVFKYLYALSGNSFIKAGIGLLCIIVVLNGECYLNFPLFMTFFFLPMTVLLQQDITLSDTSPRTSLLASRISLPT